MTETTISDFMPDSTYQLSKKLDFQIPHVRILGTNLCGAMRRADFKRRELFQDFMYCHNNDKRSVAIFSNQI